MGPDIRRAGFKSIFSYAIVDKWLHLAEFWFPRLYDSIYHIGLFGGSGNVSSVPSCDWGERGGGVGLPFPLILKTSKAKLCSWAM